MVPGQCLGAMKLLGANLSMLVPINSSGFNIDLT
jgi:hypothetical protein